jgi:hypothetical protein
MTGIVIGLIVGFSLSYLHTKWFVKRLLTTWTITTNPTLSGVPPLVSIISHTDEELIRIEKEEAEGK